MEGLSKPRVDVSDLGALEKEESPAADNDNDEYEKHQNTPKEVVGNFVWYSFTLVEKNSNILKVIGDIIGKGGFATVCKGINNKLF